MIIYEHMQLKDCEHAAELEDEIFGKDAWSVGDFEESLCCDYAIYVVARDTGSDRLVACAGVRNMCGDGDITNVLVDREYREQGIAEHGADERERKKPGEPEPAENVKDS